MQHAALGALQDQVVALGVPIGAGEQDRPIVVFEGRERAFAFTFIDRRHGARPEPVGADDENPRPVLAA